MAKKAHANIYFFRIWWKEDNKVFEFSKFWYKTKRSEMIILVFGIELPIYHPIGSQIDL